MPALILADGGNGFLLPAALVIVVALLALLAVLAVRRRAPRVEVQALPSNDVARYLEEFDAIERHFVDDPQTAAARARGMAEEVIRRMGFPDRIDIEQKARDLARHDGVAAKAIREADADLRKHGGDTEHLRRSVTRYRDAVRRLVGAGGAGSAAA